MLVPSGWERHKVTPQNDVMMNFQDQLSVITFFDCGRERYRGCDSALLIIVLVET